MTFLVWLLNIFVMIIALLLIRKYTSLEFVAHAKLLFKAWSVWLGAISAAVTGYMMQFPNAALDAWNSLPPDLKSFIPPNLLGYISPTLMVMAVLAQYVRQNKLKDRADQMRGNP
ncbi:hypothetical protein K5Y32_07215 [Pantoea sp. DY-15]|uniref:DUF7940 domain-containing protein n=1 Tax=Pantoea sp. DY-15 TaxID=2871489 RepID=UPI001C9677DB|nr:hypothetical protein [Pantoea sp. DY-15]MBY4887721.1 hypothetical protein [Pantoea sp. DY-15]